MYVPIVYGFLPEINVFVFVFVFDIYIYIYIYVYIYMYIYICVCVVCSENKIHYIVLHTISVSKSYLQTCIVTATVIVADGRPLQKITHGDTCRSIFSNAASEPIHPAIARIKAYL